MRHCFPMRVSAYWRIYAGIFAVGAFFRTRMAIPNYYWILNICNTRVHIQSWNALYNPDLILGAYCSLFASLRVHQVTFSSACWSIGQPNTAPSLLRPIPKFSPNLRFSLSNSPPLSIFFTFLRENRSTTLKQSILKWVEKVHIGLDCWRSK